MFTLQLCLQFSQLAVSAGFLIESIVDMLIVGFWIQNGRNTE